MRQIATAPQRMIGVIVSTEDGVSCHSKSPVCRCTAEHATRSSAGASEVNADCDPVIFGGFGHMSNAAPAVSCNRKRYFRSQCAPTARNGL